MLLAIFFLQNVFVLLNSEAFKEHFRMFNAHESADTSSVKTSKSVLLAQTPKRHVLQLSGSAGHVLLPALLLGLAQRLILNSSFQKTLYHDAFSLLVLLFIMLSKGFLVSPLRS